MWLIEEKIDKIKRKIKGIENDEIELLIRNVQTIEPPLIL